MADQATQLKSIADKLEGSYQALRRAASSIAGLLQLGKATCEEVRAYNLWALAIYNTQRGMLAALKAGGEKGVPDLPQYPTVFAWKGMSGESALNVSCAGGGATLSGLMGRALGGPSDANPFVGTDQVQIVTTDQYLYAPENSPSFQTLLSVQAARAQAGMGVVGVIIAIAAVAIAVTVAIAAIMHYLEVSKVQESNTEQVRQQAEAFATYTKARLDCYGTCTQQGKPTSECVSICQKLVKEPNILLPGMSTKWGWLQWTGFTVVAGLGTLAAIKLWQRHQAGKPLLDIPDFSLDGAELGAADDFDEDDDEEIKPAKKKARKGSSSTRTEVRSPTSTATEVRSPTSTSTEVRSPTSTSTDAYTSGNVTVTGGAGAGATTSVKIIAAKVGKERRVDSKAHGSRSRGSQSRMTNMIKATSAPRAPSPMPAIMEATGARKSARRSATK